MPEFISKIKLPNDETTYDIKSYKTQGIFFGKVDSTSTSTKFTATIPELTATEYYDGLTVLLKNGVVTSASGFTININGLGAKQSYSNMAAATADTTLFNINYTMLFVYDSTRVTGGGWICYRGYDANTNTIGYQLRTNSQSLPMTSIVYRYRLLFTSADNKHLVPANNSTSTNATTARSVCQDPINPFGAIYYYGTTASVAANSRPSTSYLWQQYNITLGYSFNMAGGDLTLTSWKPVYLKCAPQANGSAIIDSTTPYVQDLPTTEDGKIYIQLGIATAATTMELLYNHPIYYYKNGSIRIWINPESGLPIVSASDNGKLLTVVNGEWAPTTKPSYTATEVGALPSNTTYVSSVNGSSGAITIATPGTLNTTATTAQSTAASEALSGTITLHQIAKTGNYNDLLNKPTIPSAPGTLNTTATSAQSTSASEALSGSITLHKISKTGSYDDLNNKPAIPTVVSTYSATGTDAVNGTAVAAALATLPTPMQFTGTVGTNGTITWANLPAASTCQGYTYKVLTDHSTTPICKVGDTIISNGTEWVVIPSGDEPSGTVTSVAISNGGGLSVSGSPITSSGTITVSHSDTSSQASVSNSGRTYIQSVTLDTYGHVTALSSATELVTDTNTTYTLNVSGTGDNANKVGLVAGGSGSGTNWYTIPYASVAGSANAVAWGNVSSKPDSFTPASHTHGNIANGGTITSTAVATTTSDYILFSDASNSGKIERNTFQSTMQSLINSLDEGTSVANRNDYIIAQYVNGGTTNTNYYRRKLSNIFGALTASDIPTLTASKISDFTSTARAAISGTSPISYDNTSGGISHIVALSEAAASGLYKIAVNVYGHVTSTTAVAKADITGLGIPGSDTNTTYTLNVSGTGDNVNKVGLVAGGSGSGTTWYTIPYATSAGTAASASSVAWASVSGHDAGVDADLGINTSSGDTTKFLNAKGEWTVPAGTYVHPAYDTATAAAVKIGRDSTGHVTIGAALTAADVGAATSGHTHTYTLNGSSTTSLSFYAPTGAGTSGQYLKSNGSGAPSWTNFPAIPSITLNGSSTISPSFYAPTSAGTSGYVLQSNGSGAPTWVTPPSGLPSVTSSDNDKVLTVVNGAWAAAEPTSCAVIFREWTTS